jgi:2,3-diketo-5-methylthio-1-phosphopentane phosphatase
MLTPHLLFDIEGTTTAVDYVYSVLFPYARTNMESYLMEHATTEELRALAQAFDTQHTQDTADSVTSLPVDPQAEPAALRSQVMAAALDHMKADRKTTALKELQGRIWNSGYQNGELKGHVYDDVAPAFARFRAAGHTLHIYSSGSVQAQKLIFGYSVVGDLTTMLTSYYDTTTGAKKVAQSYVDIARALGVPTSEVTFFTDNSDEARAAADAGMAVFVVRRPGDNAEVPAGMIVLQDFSPLLA